MNREVVDRIVNAVLYEGYLLYPYRASVKNRQRWTFGGLYPEAYCRARNGSDAWSNQTECLIEGSGGTSVEVVLRFLQPTAREVGEFPTPLPEWAGGEPPFRRVESLRVGDRILHAWQEAEERAVAVEPTELGAMQRQPARRSFAMPVRRWLEPVHAAAGIVGVLVREQQAVQGSVELSACEVAEGVWKLTVRVANRTPWDDALETPRADALLRSLVSTHAILGVVGGQFVSLFDPPDQLRAAAADCRNVGTWPVLVGTPGQRDTMLSSPIILYDYPQVAPESPGDLFDATEIDEILTLRILTLTDEEKRQMASVEERARRLLERTEALAGEQLLGLHGLVRRRPSTEGVHE